MGLSGAFKLILILAFVPQLTWADSDKESWIRGRLVRAWSQSISHLEKIQTPTSEELGRIDDLRYEFAERIEGIRTQKFNGLSYNPELLRTLEQELLPRIDRLNTRLGRFTDDVAYRQRQQERTERVLQRDRELRSLLKGLSPRNRAGLERALALLAFARSGTLEGGKIGDWNPASTDAIQSSAESGLKRVLSNIKRGRAEGWKFDLRFFQDQQALLLGAAAHFFSRPGEIPFRDVVREDGTAVPLRAYIDRWLGLVEKAPVSSIDSLHAYAWLIHIHPFGDSNGRIAEISKQLVLQKLGLPALLTPEKSAIESYFDALGWGARSFVSSTLAQVEETIAFSQAWVRLLEHGWTLDSVTLAGANVVAHLTRPDGKRAVAVSLRALETPVEGPLPPSENAIVLAGRDSGALRIRLGINGGPMTDLAPIDVIQASRKDTIQAAYPLFLRELGPNEHGEVRFAFHYTHENGSEIWFNNGGRDFRSSPCVDALSAVE